MDAKNTTKINMIRSQLRYHVSTNYFGYPFELKTKLQALLRPGQEPKKKFIIFTTGRSGSTLLVDLMNSHPSVHSDLELLKRKLVNPAGVIKQRSKLANADVYGFKLLSYQLRDVQSGIKKKKIFFNSLVDMGYKPIHLYRENLIFQSLSLIYALYRFQWHNKNGKDQKKSKMWVDVEKLEKTITDLELLREYEEQTLYGLHHLKVSYERDLENGASHSNTIARISEFLELPKVEPNTKLRKVTPSSLSKFVVNEEEVMTFLENSRFIEYMNKPEKISLKA